MIWIIAVGLYVFLGLGVALAFEDDKHRSLLVFALSVIFWPALFMFGATMAIRAVAEGKPSVGDARLGWTVPVPMESMEAVSRRVPPPPTQTPGQR